MATREQLQLVQGSYLDILAHTPQAGEVWFDTTNNILWVGDGAVAGGWPIAGFQSTASLAFRARNVDLNATGDTNIAMQLAPGFSRYQIVGVQIVNASTSLTAVQAGVFTLSGGGGTTIAAAQALSAVTATTPGAGGNGMAMTLALPPATWFNAIPLFFNVSTPQGGAATCDVIIQVAPMS